MSPAIAEIWLTAAICVVLLVEVFAGHTRRGLTGSVTLLVLAVGVALSVLPGRSPSARRCSTGCGAGAHPEQMIEFNQRVIRRTTDLRNFKQDVLVLIITGRIAGFNLPLLVDHIRREAEYFIMTLTHINQGIDDPIEASIVRENIFWLRIMMDHHRFIRHLLDPSQREPSSTPRSSSPISLTPCSPKPGI